jgi:hypothetical protein
MDDPIDRSTQRDPQTRRLLANPQPGAGPDQQAEPKLPPYLLAGNRFASAGLGFSVVGLTCASASFLPIVAWVAAGAGVALSATGFVKYCRQGATNRDTSILGGLIGWLALVILLTRFSVEHQIPLPPLQ